MSNILKSEDILRKMTYCRNKKVILPSETTGKPVTYEMNWKKVVICLWLVMIS